MSDRESEEADGDEDHLEDEDEDEDENLSYAERIDVADHIVVLPAGKIARLFVQKLSYLIIRVTSTDTMSLFFVNLAIAQTLI